MVKSSRRTPCCLSPRLDERLAEDLGAEDDDLGEDPGSGLGEKNGSSVD